MKGKEAGIRFFTFVNRMNRIGSFSYKLIALAPKTPATADATAITTFRIISHTDFFIAIIYLLSRSLNSLVYSVFLPYFPPEKAYDSPAWRNNAPRSN
jgi:hypothetical protein